MSAVTAVLDACVLVPAPLRDTLLRASQKGLIQPFWSADILDEVERTLVRRGMTTEEQARRLMAVLRTSFPEAYVRNYRRHMRRLTNAAGDRHVLAAAIAAGAQTIVTSNLTFLSELFGIHGYTMATVIAEQATALRKPPTTVDSLLDRLAVSAPVFVALMREDFFKPGHNAAQYLNQEQLIHVRLRR